ncbi:MULTISPECIES: hypothetical protein [Klebsiella]|uniref:hypothetical protein n=1 Tax=Klebsiella TaxID=570 RepID=UPI0007D70D9F|nr:MULTISPECIES: hypothetical protein [Klebsiella]MCQ4186500.1 hypothetical protein [Klebsiella pneumoniae]MDC8515690.1 hypothetical protein [Klebsiella pneumoniae]MDP1242341.1 hypothetical protein [Klebsiella pneumoniae]MDS7875063.1 hypothetical protein [Klebsiella pasteurii]MEB5805121.1 hypothetical protein [Klebsiella pneumoniae]
MSKPTDEEIIQVLSEHGQCMTYVVAYWLRRKHKSTNTAYALRRLKKLEAIGVVKRMKSSYKTQICWGLA